MRHAAGTALVVISVLASIAAPGLSSPAAPAAPSDLAANRVGGDRIDLTWSDNSPDETGFELQRRIKRGPWETISIRRNRTGFSDTGLAPGKYCYRIRSVNASGASAYVRSAPKCTKLRSGGGGGGGSGERPAAPSALTAQEVSATRIDLDWLDNSTDEKGFKLQRRIDGGRWRNIRLPADATSYSDQRLGAGVHCYRIRSFNRSGKSAYVFSVPNCITLRGGAGSIEAQPVVTGLSTPLFVTAPIGDDRLFILERAGRIRVVENGVLLPQPFLDIVSITLSPGERGLLGLAFPTDYASTGLFYVYYIDLAGDSVLARYQVSGNRNLANAGSAEILLTVAQPFRNHNGGTIVFGADGYLYLGLGDGGSGGDPNNLAQNDATLLGKMLRLDVGGGLGSGYSIPADNPFAGGVLPLPEIWSKGWRNPYRFSIDRVFGDIYVGDVGQALIEEISVEPFGSAGGLNYGWRLMEGKSCFNPPTNCNDGSLTLPVYDYAHTGGRCSVTGGYVYRGSIAAIYGHYFFADFCTGEVFSFVWDGGSGLTEFTDRTAEIAPPGGFGLIAGFGEDGFGELYIVGFGGTIYKLVRVP